MHKQKAYSHKRAIATSDFAVYCRCCCCCCLAKKRNWQKRNDTHTHTSTQRKRIRVRMLRLRRWHRALTIENDMHKHKRNIWRKNRDQGKMTHEEIYLHRHGRMNSSYVKKMQTDGQMDGVHEWGDDLEGWRNIFVISWDRFCPVANGDTLNYRFWQYNISLGMHHICEPNSARARLMKRRERKKYKWMQEV